MSLPPARPPRGGTKPTNALPRLKDEAEEREGGDLPVPPQACGQGLLLPCPHPCAAPPRIGIWLARTICSFRPVAMATGWLEMGFHRQRPGTLGKKIQAGKSLPFFFPRGKRQGEGGILPAEAASLPSFLPMPPSCPQAPPACLPLPSHLSLALQFESPLRVCSGARWAVAVPGVCCEVSCLPQHGGRQRARGVLRGGAAVPPRAAALGSLPLPQPWCCSHLAPTASTGATGARLLSWGRSRCSPLQATAVSVSHHLPWRPRAVLSTRTFRTSAGGWLGLCSMLSPDSGSKILGSCLLGRGWAPPLPMQNLWLHGNMLAGGQVWTGKWAGICCRQRRRDLASGSASAPAEPRPHKEAGQIPSPSLCMQPREAVAVCLFVLMQRVTYQSVLLPVFLTK